MSDLLKDAIALNDEGIAILKSVADELKAWKPKGISHKKVITRGKNKGNCKSCGLNVGI